MQSSSRQAYLDWLRIIAILGVLFFHSAMAYVAEWGWHIKNKETSYLLMEFNFFLHQFRMPLLFFISGTVTYFMLQKRSGGSFIGLRFRRLFVPLVMGMLIVVPPQVYMERLTQGFKGGFTDFYSSIFTTGPYPKGNMSWHHLWFILYLFLYDGLFAGIFKWCLSDKGKRKMDWINGLAKGKRIYMLMMPGVILYTSLSIRFPETNDLVHDFCYFFYWLFFLLAGFICINFSLLMDSLEKNRRTSLAIAVITILMINYLRWNQLEPYKIITDWQHDWRTYLYRSLYPFTAWTWVFTAIGYARRYLNKKHKALDYLNQAVYPFYILHQTIIIIVVYYVVQTNDTIIMKYLFTVIVSFLVTMSIYHVFIKPFAVTRFLFGMKPQKKEIGSLAIEPPVKNEKRKMELAS